MSTYNRWRHVLSEAEKEVKKSLVDFFTSSRHSIYADKQAAANLCQRALKFRRKARKQ
jgi:hypothetical protein